MVSYPDTVASPSNHVALIVVTMVSPDGQRHDSAGSGAIVGRNEILTAAHVVQPPAGWKLVQVRIYPEAEALSLDSTGNKAIQISNPHYTDFVGVDITNGAKANWQVNYFPIALSNGQVTAAASKDDL